MHVCIHVLNGMHLWVSCAALSALFGARLSTHGHTNWCPLYLHQLLCVLPVCGLLSQCCVGRFSQLLVMYTHQLRRKE